MAGNPQKNFQFSDFSFTKKMNTRELIKSMNGQKRFGITWKAETMQPSPCATESATNICAPYGMIPWKTQLNVSKIDAAFFGEIP